MTNELPSTALEAFRASADADVYLFTDLGWSFLVTGMQTRSGVALVMEDGHGVRFDLELLADERVSPRVYH
jgi:hypothetical protein